MVIKLHAKSKVIFIKEVFLLILELERNISLKKGDLLNSNIRRQI